MLIQKSTSPSFVSFFFVHLTAISGSLCNSHYSDIPMWIFHNSVQSIFLGEKKWSSRLSSKPKVVIALLNHLFSEDRHVFSILPFGQMPALVKSLDTSAYKISISRIIVFRILTMDSFIGISIYILYIIVLFSLVRIWIYLGIFVV